MFTPNCAASIAGVPDNAGAPMAIAWMLALTAAAAASPRLIGGWRQAEVAAGRPSIVNCTWQNFTQKIDHFGDAPGTFPQRLCLYDKWWRPGGGAGSRFRAAANAPGPILFYTGNESPVDEYVNNTGLMWEIGERLGALLVLAPTRTPNPSPDDTRPLTRTLTRALTPTLTPNNPPTGQARCSCLPSTVTSHSRTRRCAARTASAASPTARPPRPSPTGSPSLRRCGRSTARTPPSWRLVAHVRGRHSEPRGGEQHETHTHTQQDTHTSLSMILCAAIYGPCPAIYHPRRRDASGLVPYEVPRGSRRCHRRLRAHLAGMAYLLY